MHHVKTQAPYAVFVGLMALFFGDLLSGYLYPMWTGLLITILVVLVIGFFISAKPDSESDRVDPYNRLFAMCCGCGGFSRKWGQKVRCCFKVVDALGQGRVEPALSWACFTALSMCCGQGQVGPNGVLDECSVSDVLLASGSLCLLACCASHVPR